MSLQTVFLVGGYKKEKSIPLDSGSWGPLLWVPRREKRNTQFDTCRERKNNTRSGGIEGKGGKEGDGRVSIKMQSSVRTPPSYCCRSFPTLQAKKRKNVHFQIIGLAGQEDGVWTSGGGGGRAVDEHWSIFPLLPPDPYPHAWNEERKLGKERKAIDTTYYFAQT